MEKLIITVKDHKLLPFGKGSNYVLFSLSKIAGEGFRTALALSLLNMKENGFILLGLKDFLILPCFHFVMRR